MTLALTACNQQTSEVLSPTPVELATATPGGRINVWVATPTFAQVAEQPADALPAGAVNPAQIQESQPPIAAVPDGSGLLSCTTPGEPSLPASAPPITGFVDIFLGYLATGGPPTVLQSTLVDWGAIDDEHGLLGADRDLTGNGEFEVLIQLQAPDAETDQPLPPGDLLIFGCESGDLKLLHQAGYNPDISLPRIAAVQDLTGDALDDIVYSRQTCDLDFCSESVIAITFNEETGAFDSLISGSVRAPNAEISVGDADEDGTPDLAIRENVLEIPESGPLRERTVIYAYDGDNLVVTETINPERPYRIHVIQDADRASQDGDFAAAITDYQRAADLASNLRSWTLTNEDPQLRAYAGYRLVVAQAAAGDFEAAQASFDALSAEFGEEGATGNVYFQIARAFWESYQPEQTVAEGCAAAQGFAINAPDALTFLSSFGSANPSYDVEDICPL